MSDTKAVINVDPWARLRFSIISGLLASPPKHGQMGQALADLAAKNWHHPLVEGHLLHFDVKTIERWYYQARGVADPLAALARRVRSDVGQTRVASSALMQVLEAQYKAHTDWSYQLHYDNLQTMVAERSDLGPMPSYATIKRTMKKSGFRPRRKEPAQLTAGQITARRRREDREVRSFEVSYVHGLWHLDFHHGGRQIVDRYGQWHTPKALCVIDDCCRVSCHLQWYLDETACSLVHGVIQAFYKRGLPRAILTDNGSAMLSMEFRNGLERLGIKHETTLAYSAYQNGKQEALWGQVEGRLMKMLGNVEPLSLKDLNDASQAWVEMEYNRRPHRELSMSPLERLIQGPAVGRPAPSAEDLRLAFCQDVRRKQRRSDGTVSIQGIRFEVPWHYNHLDRLRVRYQSWDLSVAFLVDERTGSHLTRMVPLDKRSNADGRRRPTKGNASSEEKPSAKKSSELPPLLRRYMAEYAATGLPPAYLSSEPPSAQTLTPAPEEVSHD